MEATWCWYNAVGTYTNTSPSMHLIPASSHTVSLHLYSRTLSAILTLPIHTLRTIHTLSLPSRHSHSVSLLTPFTLCLSPHATHPPALSQAVEMLAHVVLNHVPVEDYCFRNKCVYITHIVRRVLKTVIDRSLLDDKVSLWFNLVFDLFKKN